MKLWYNINKIFCIHSLLTYGVILLQKSESVAGTSQIIEQYRKKCYNEIVKTAAGRIGFWRQKLHIKLL